MYRVSLKYELSTRKFSINRRESPMVRYATTCRRLFRNEATDNNRDLRSVMVGNEKRMNANPEKVSSLPFKSDPSRDSISHDKSKIRNASGNSAVVRIVPINFFSTIFRRSSRRFRYFRLF